MRLRLLFLLLVATVSGTVVGLTDNARAGKPRAVLAGSGSGAAAHRHAAEPVPGADAAPRRVPGGGARTPTCRWRCSSPSPRSSRISTPDARSSAGARGLLQVLPATAAEFELDTDHVGANVLAGARYLRQLLDRFGSTELALAAYNAARRRSSAGARDRTTRPSRTSRT